MNKILIATDLSAASRNASVYGMQLAKAIKADVILFSAYQVARSLMLPNITIDVAKCNMLHAIRNYSNDKY